MNSTKPRNGGTIPIPEISYIKKNFSELQQTIMKRDRLYVLERFEFFVRESQLPNKFWNINGNINQSITIPWDNYYIWGNVGVGKTYAMAMLVKRLALHQALGYGDHTTALFVNVSTFISKLKGMLHINEPISEEKQRLIDCDYLFLDDLGAEMNTPFLVDTMYQIVDDRYNQNKHIAVTSNLNPDELGDQIGNRISSRLIEMCTVVHLGGCDRRKRKK